MNNNGPIKEMYFYDMDQAKEFQNYYPKQNYPKIIKNTRKIMKQILDKKKKIMGNFLSDEARRNSKETQARTSGSNGQVEI